MEMNEDEDNKENKENDKNKEMEKETEIDMAKPPIASVQGMHLYVSLI